MEMQIPSWGEVGTGKINYSSLKAHSQFHHSWQNIHTHGEQNSPRVASPLVGNLLPIRGDILPLLVELGMCLSWLIGNLKFLHSWLRHSWRNFPVPTSPHDGIHPIPYRYGIVQFHMDTELFNSIWIRNCSIPYGIVKFPTRHSTLFWSIGSRRSPTKFCKS